MKGRRVLSSMIVALATVCIFTPSIAQAANTTCANATFLFPGEHAEDFISASSSLYYKAAVKAGRSYAILAWAPYADAGQGSVSLDLSQYSNNTCTTGASGADSQDHEPLMSTDAHGGDHDSIVPTATGTLYIRLQNGAAFAYYTHVVIVETTLFSPWWFTGGTNQAYIEVRNSMSSQATAQVTLYQANGNVCGTTNVTLNANGNAAIEVNTIGTCAGAVSGSAQIAFGGTPGGLTGNITTINVPNGTSFDSPFTPRMVWSMTSR